ncbi:MAG: hypothetical protein JRI25_20140 [Deltaproteobacteria bacterium]|nr:hypothetical protein [Deltaproteobacteria bacterium]
MTWSTDDVADLEAFTDEYVLARLADLAKGGSPEFRADAALRLGPALEWVDEELADDDLSWEVVKRARTALRSIHDDQGEPELVRRKALEASVRYPEPWHADAVRAALDRGGAWRITGVFCAGRYGGCDDDIRAACRSGDPDLILVGLAAAGSLEGFEDVGRIAVRLAADPETSREMRLEVVSLLGNLRDDRGQVFKVLDDLSMDPDQELAEIAAEALSEYLLWERLAEEEEDFEL